MTFSEAADPKQSGLELIASDGRTLATGGAAVAPDQFVLPVASLSNGPYTVLWHTVSAADGDAAHGFFAFQVGPDKPATTQIRRLAIVSGVQVTFDVTPGRVGANEYHVTVGDGTNALTNVLRVRLRTERADRDIGVSFTDLAASAGAYDGSDVELAYAGGYKLTVEVRRKDILDDVKFPFDVVVPAPAEASTSPSAVAVTATAAPSAGPMPTSNLDGLPWAAVAAGLLVGSLFVLRKTRRG